MHKFNKPYYLRGGEGNDRVYGYGRKNRMYAGLGDDHYYGYGNRNTVDYTGFGQAITLLPGGIDDVIGTGQNDIIIGHNRANSLTGGRGDDEINGLAGNDILIGVQPSGENDLLLNPGDQEIDRLVGGEGEDLFWLGDCHSIYYLGLAESYALIEDFQTNIDKIQLVGTIDDYTFEGADTFLLTFANKHIN